MAENPKVHAKGDQHGMPRTPGKVSHPGRPAESPFHHERIAPTSAQEMEHGTVHSYAPDHPAMGGMHHGAKAVHPTHDAAQHAHEKKGYG